MKARTLLRLGRVSNLPTVWTNALAGAAIAAAGGPINVGGAVLAALALTLFYEGGMWLNDAFDAEIDRVERPTRPIPSGEIGRPTAFAGGGALLVGGIGLGAAASPAAGAVGVALAVAILLYDWLHKRTALSPLLMGATRFLSYVFAAAACGAVDMALALGAAGLFAWIVGLTYAAKGEAQNRLGAAWPLAALAAPLLYAGWLSASAPAAAVFVVALAAVAAAALRRLRRRGPGDVPRAVVTMIAGVSLYDAALIAAAGQPALAVAAAAGFALTLALQRVAPGT